MTAPEIFFIFDSGQRIILLFALCKIYKACFGGGKNQLYSRLPAGP